MTIQQASKQLLFQLYHIYDDREAKNIANLVMENITEWKRIDRVMNKNLTLSPQKQSLLAAYTDELLAHKPVQYVLREAWFYGLKLYVDENVLIPRPETEELLDWIYQDQATTASAPRILDVGTGSGCIALGLKKKLPQSTVVACDLSDGALNIAKKNASLVSGDVHFIQGNYLEQEFWHQLPEVDIIVSNPPYIPLQDKNEMHANVLQHEPHIALFVEDQDPLVFYKAITEFAKTKLNDPGIVYVEIHEQMGGRVVNLFVENGLTNVELRNDLQGRPRMVKAVKTVEKY